MNRTPSQRGRYSRNKGLRGEREAVKYLKSLGYQDARRLSQSDGSNNAEVEISPYSCLHVEVKYGYPLISFDLGTSLFRSACEQAERDSQNRGVFWVVLWRPHRQNSWRLSFKFLGGVATVCGDADIKVVLRAMEKSCDQQQLGVNSMNRTKKWS